MISVIWRADLRGKAPSFSLPPRVEVLVGLLVCCIVAAHQPFCQHWSGQALGYQVRIVVQSVEDLGKHLGLVCRSYHAIDFSLQLGAGDWALPELCQRVGTAQV